jgi:hypothetical protein
VRDASFLGQAFTKSNFFILRSSPSVIGDKVYLREADQNSCLRYFHFLE